jgi:DNA repair protein RadA/Sms
VDLAKAMEGAWEPGAGAEEPSGVGDVERGLAGEIRRVAGVERRLAEAARLGFARALVPPDSGVQRPDLRVQEVGDVALVLDNLR